MDSQRDFNALVRVNHLLQDLHADLYIHDAQRFGSRVLLRAAENGKLVIAQKSLQYGGNLRGRGDNSQQPLLLAAKHGHTDMVRLLLRRQDISTDCKDAHRRTPLSWAAERGYDDVVQLLLAKSGTDIAETDVTEDEGSDFDYFTPHYSRIALWFAACNGHEKVVELLLAEDCIKDELCQLDQPNAANGCRRKRAPWRSEGATCQGDGLTLVHRLARIHCAGVCCQEWP